MKNKILLLFALFLLPLLGFGQTTLERTTIPIVEKSYIDTAVVAVGTLVYVTDDVPGLYIYKDGAVWVQVSIPNDGSTGNTSTANNSTVWGKNNAGTGLNSTISGGISHICNEESATIGGGENNEAGGIYSTIGGGQNNTAPGRGHVIGGGVGNTTGGEYSTIAGGQNNAANAIAATIGGGLSNTVSEENATIGGGASNTASGFYATVGGGSSNTASGGRTTIGGGDQNTASGQRASVIGGQENTASGDYSTAMGYLAVSNNHGEVSHGNGHTGFNYSTLFLSRTATTTTTTEYTLYPEGTTGTFTLPSNGVWAIIVHYVFTKTSTNATTSGQKSYTVTVSGDTGTLSSAYGTNDNGGTGSFALSVSGNQLSAAFNSGTYTDEVKAAARLEIIKITN